MAMNLAIAAFLLASTLFSAALPETSATTLTIHNLCPYPVWPLITPNDGFPVVVYDKAARVIPNALLSAVLPPTAWAGRVTARTGCGAGAGASCGTGAAPPSTVAQLQVHQGAGADEAGYSVSLVEGFNVPMVISPQGDDVIGECPALGCAVDLNCDCPPDQQAAGGAACLGPPDYFKSLCPLTRTAPPDVEPVPQSCRAPGELKIVLCQPTQPSRLQGAAGDWVNGTVVEGDS